MTTSGWPLADAHMMGVNPLLSALFTSMPGGGDRDRVRVRVRVRVRRVEVRGGRKGWGDDG